MKKLLLLTLTMVAISSCKKEPVKDYALLSGNIENFRKRNIILKGYNFEKKIKFDRKTKTFSDTLRGIIPGHYTMFIGKRPVPIYLTKNEDLTINVDGRSRTKDPIYVGKNTAINTYLTERRKKFSEVLGNANKLFSSEEDDFLNKMDSYKQSLEKLATQSQLPEDYLTKEKRNIKYEYARNISNYQNYHRILTGDEDFYVSDDFPNDVKEINFNNSEDYINSFSYRTLLKEHLNNVATDKTIDGGDFYLTHIETVQTEIVDSIIKNDLLYKIAQQGITYTSNLEEFFRKFKAYSTDSLNNIKIADLYNKLKLTAKGKPSPKFKGYQNYEGGTTSLDDLLNKGKYLYIDLWATWCGFCKKEIPLLKNFEQKYHNSKIEFVSINVDTKDKYTKWKKTIKDKEMTGVQLFAGKSHTNLPFAQKYLIKGLPRFILLDPEGKIISPNAPRPSDGYKLDEMFEEIGIGENLGEEADNSEH